MSKDEDDQDDILGALLHQIYDHQDMNQNHQPQIVQKTDKRTQRSSSRGSSLEQQLFEFSIDKAHELGSASVSSSSLSPSSDREAFKCHLPQLTPYKKETKASASSTAAKRGSVQSSEGMGTGTVMAYATGKMKH